MEEEQLSPEEEALDTLERLNEDLKGYARLETTSDGLIDLKREHTFPGSGENVKNVFITMGETLNERHLNQFDEWKRRNFYIELNGTTNIIGMNWIENNRERIKLLQVKHPNLTQLEWIIREKFKFYLALEMTDNMILEDEIKPNELMSGWLMLFQENLNIISLHLAFFAVHVFSEKDVLQLFNLANSRDVKGVIQCLRYSSGFPNDVSYDRIFFYSTTVSSLLCPIDSSTATFFFNYKELKNKKISLQSIKFKGVTEVVVYIKNKKQLRPLLEAVLPYIKESADITECIFSVNSQYIDISTLNYEEAHQIQAIFKSRELKRLDELLKNNKKGLYNRAKMMVVGDGAAGKTSVVRSLVGKKFNKKHVSTVVGEKLTANISNNDVNLGDWNVVGSGDNVISQDFLAMGKKIVANEDLIEDSDSEVLSQVSKTIDDIVDLENEKKYHHSEPISKLFREKSKRITKQKKNFFAGFRGNMWKKKSLLPNFTNRGPKLSIYDFGGQKVFDVLHHLYLTNAGLVLLVVNLLLFLTDPEEAVEKLKNWLQSLSVYTNNVRVFIIGTRARNKKVKANFGGITETLHKVLIEFDILDIASNGDLRFFPVDNSLGKKNEKYLQSLKTSISAAFSQYSTTLSLPANEEIPLAWMFFLRLIHRDFSNITSLEELYKKGASMGFELKEMKEFVAFFTKAGILVSFHERFKNIRRGSADMVDDVVLRPEWLLKALATFICDESLHENEFQKVATQKNMGKLVAAYTRSGILADSMLEQVLRLNEASEREIAFIKNVCVKMLVMSRLSSVPTSLDLAPRHFEAANGFWLVPSMNKVTTIQGQTSDDSVITTGTIVWDDIVPHGLFERCICALLDQDVVETRLLSLSTSAAVLEYKGVNITFGFHSSREYRVSVSTKNPMILKEVKVLLVNLNSEVNSLGFALKVNAKIDFANEIVLNSVQDEQRVEPRSTEIVWDCFLSHTWGKGQKTHRKVVDIARRLQERGVSVWLDEEQMKGNIVYQMVDGINRSGCFIAFITEEYLVASDNEDSNAGKELHYAIKHGTGNMIPVLLDSNYADPKTWKYSAGLVFGSALYIDFTTETKIKANLGVLCERIKQLVEKRKGN